MKKENAISINTGCQCINCQSTVFLKLIKDTVPLGNNGVLGPGFRSYSHEYVVTTYFCGKCGTVFMPTILNRLSENIDSYEKIATKIFEKTVPRFLNRNLVLGEVFEEIQKEGTINSYVMTKDDDDLLLLEAGSSVRTIIDKKMPNSIFENHLLRGVEAEKDFYQYPYIVFNDSGSKLIWWAKKIKKNILLTKEERFEKSKALRVRLSKLENERDRITENNKNGSSKQKISTLFKTEIPSLQNQIKNLKSTTKTVVIDNDPLPEGAVMADSVMVLDFDNKSRIFYLPVSAID